MARVPVVGDPINTNNVQHFQAYGFATYNLVSSYSIHRIWVIENNFLWYGVDIGVITKTTAHALQWRDYNLLITQVTRGVGLAWRTDVPIQNVRLQSSGRIISATLFDVLIVGVYAHSGTGFCKECDALFTEDLTLLLHDYNPTKCILLGDVNTTAFQAIYHVHSRGQSTLSSISEALEICGFMGTLFFE